MMTPYAAFGLALLTLGWPVVDAAAQGAPPEPSAVADGEGANSANVTSYQASFFANSRPSTALEMIQRTPAFSFNGGNQNVRGLAGSAGNVLIDGQPQTAKSVTLTESLSRIPAAQVARIDVIRGGAGGIDMLGFPVVANVVRVAGAISQYSAQVEPKSYAENVPIDFVARVDGSRRSGDLLLTGAVEARRMRPVDVGEGYQTRFNSTGRQVDSGEYSGAAGEVTLNANGALEYRHGATLIRSNLGLERREANRQEISRLASLEYFKADEAENDLEVGANVEQRFTPWFTGRVDLLQTLEDKTRTAGRIAQQATTDTLEGESILRGTLVMRPRDTLSFETGVEGAFNFLEQDSTLTTANANVRVEERRAQPFATVNWQVWDPLSLEFGLRYETSTISQTGDTNSERSFSFLKPRAIAAIEIGGKLQLRLRAEKDVRQLNFNDFAASAGATDSTASAGNADLQPERAWVYEAAFEQRLWARSAIVFTYAHEEVEETLDYVPVGLTSDGKGNIGDATRDIYTLDMKVALDPLGLRGGRLEVLPIYYASKGIDPFTHETRSISGTQQWRGRVNLYLDRPEIKSTFGWEAMIGSRDRSWRNDQVQTNLQTVFHTLWGEWQPRPSMRIRLTAFNVGFKLLYRDRFVYAGRRGPVTPLSFVEERKFHRGPAYSIRLRQTF
jgi:outer membrane receptor protein involved in Fe transport